MKKLSAFLAGFLCLLSLMAIMAFKPNPPGPSVNGQGALLLSYFNGEVAHFSFHASTDANGIVTGSWEGKSPGQDIRAHGTIDCLTILTDGKTAIVRGAVTQSSDGFIIPVGDRIVFRIKDNGEGAKATEDQFSDWYNQASANCNLIFNAPMYPILNGNIQVKQ